MIVATIAGVSAIVVALVPVLIAARRAAHRATETLANIREVHILVNSQKTEAAAYRDMLIFALRSAGVEVPQDPRNTD